ncbi:hypothetical protein GUJ93_ZPchr0006g43620 [Zizania palustris]|uniref:Uncharacterized protein n=1 Tax=Zizania palustris TaxID=103762 RepID=A0A8J5TDJ8_ZIZPA|nr:hypothetical protein GUJ93_ZPchr0006g43620 [Zizania palustris]
MSSVQGTTLSTKSRRGAEGSGASRETTSVSPSPSGSSEAHEECPPPARIEVLTGAGSKHTLTEGELLLPPQGRTGRAVTWGARVRRMREGR